MAVLKVKRIPPIGINDYPALKNIVTGRVYVDVCLGDFDPNNRYLKANEDGFNNYGNYVKFNIPGAR
jgi:hypothetical protein